MNIYISINNQYWIRRNITGLSKIKIIHFIRKSFTGKKITKTEKTNFNIIIIDSLFPMLIEL